MFKMNVQRAVLAGLAGTAAMTAVVLLAPSLGMPPMSPGRMLGSVMGGSPVLGWLAHFMIGLVLAAIYAAFFVGRLRGAAPLRGVTYGLLPWLLAQLVVLPMMGMGPFGGSALAAFGSLIGHAAYGVTVGWV